MGKGIGWEKGGLGKYRDKFGNIKFGCFGYCHALVRAESYPE
jgi:hypothetical protein